MRNDNPSEHVIINLTFLNFIKLLLKEIGDYFYSFFEKKIKQFSLLPGAKDPEGKIVYYNELKEKEKISFDLYIEDILEFDPKFKNIFQLYQKFKILAIRSSFIQYLKTSPYYLISFIKFLLSAIILVFYFCYTINGNDYVCSYNLAFNYTMTNNTFFSIINNTYIDNSYSINNSFHKDLFNNYSYWPCKLGKCKVEKIKFGKIKILRVVYFIFFDLPLIAHGIYFLFTFKKFEFKKSHIILYQLAEYIVLLIIFIINLIDTQSCFYSDDDPKIFYKENIKNYNLLLILFDKIFNKFSLN